MNKKSNYIRLLDNHIYPTYQLFAVMDNRKTDVHDGLRIAALTVLEWLRQRIGTNIPPELELPGPEEYAHVGNEELKPAHINRGYTIDITTLPEGCNAFWSLQIVEPDLGSNPGNIKQSRSAVPGRVIETNIGFRICGNEMECGFQTVISDPEGVEPAEVYRLAVVRRLLENPDFGLRQVLTLKDTAAMLDSAAAVRKLSVLMKEEKNQLPSVVFTYYAPEKEKTQPSLKKPAAQALLDYAEKPMSGFAMVTTKEHVIEMPKTEYSGKKVPMQPSHKKKNEATTTVKIIGQPTKKEYELLFDVKEFARHNKACCRTYILGAELLDEFRQETGLAPRAGDIIVLYPAIHGVENEIIRCTPSESVREHRLNALSAKIYAYPRDKKYDFGRIHFQAEAKDSIYESRKRAHEKSENLVAANKIALELQRSDYEQKLCEKDDVIDRLQRQLEYYAEQEKKWSNEKLQLEQEHGRQLKELECRLEKLEEGRGSIERRKKYPKQLNEVSQWARKAYSEHLVMHERTDKTLATSGSQMSVVTICDALDFLANDYWEFHFGMIDENEMNRRCTLKYDRPFDVRPVGDMTVEFTPLEYKIKYLMSGTEKRKEYPLNMHLAVGNTNPYLLRIYFFFDDVGKKLVVGSLPDHLSSVTIK